ncbi:MAG: DEAD/DEAH box helicase [Rhizobiales bacterium]|nr:DEAD/DEAH box helicase [Rhizobacter sp.]
MALLRESPEASPHKVPAKAQAPTSHAAIDTPVPGELVPRLTLQTLTRGDGLLGMRAMQGFGPRGAQLTVARIDWSYTTEAGLRWETPAPTGVLNTRPKPTELLRGAWNERVLLQRDLRGEADARDALAATGLRPLPMRAIQWRDREAGAGQAELWALPEESQFGDFWADEVPKLRKAGWSVVVQPGFAHLSAPVDRWHLVIDPLTGDAHAQWPTGIKALRQPVREGSFMLSLGIEVDGETLDLAPLLADLLKRDSRWLDARMVASIDNAALIALRAPGGRRIEAPAGPLKAIVGAMLDLLTDPRRKEGPLRLSSWEAQRIEAMRLTLLDTQAARAGRHGAWQFQGDAGLTILAQRLRAAGASTIGGVPAGLGLTLRPYQLQGLAWMQYLREHRLAGILADDMGLGKTAQVLAHLLVEKHAGRLGPRSGAAANSGQPALVVLPTSLIANWQAEAARHAPALRVLVLQGADRAREFARIAEHDVVFTTYPLLWRDVEALTAQAWHLLILDEAQMVKNAASRAATALRQLDATHRLCVTGTPLENHLGELWAHFDFLMPGFLGDTKSFQRLWRKPIETNGETLRAELLAQRVRPFILRRRKDDVAAELPPKTEVIRLVQLRGQQRALYESVRVAADEQVRRVLARMSFAGAQITILDALLKLRQVCCDPYLVKGQKLPMTMERAKLEWLRDMLPRLVEEGRRVLVFSQFTEMLALVATELETLQLPHLALTGETPVRARGAVVKRFQAKEVPIFLLSLKAGGVGLNLTAADTVIHLDPWWNPAVERQATDRAHRIGQDQPVFVYKLVVEGSIEERMLALQSRKAALAEGVLGADAAGAIKFSADDLRGLLAPLA